MSTLYQRLLGEKFDRLPQAVRQLHTVMESLNYNGTCDVTRGKSFLSNLFADMLSLPKAGKNVAVNVHLSKDADKEVWTRTFNGKRFRSVQWQKNNLMYERLRFTTLVFAVHADTESLSLELKQVYLFGIPAIGFLKPTVIARETQNDGDFHFHIRTTLPMLGLLVQYQGTLRP